MVHVKVDAQFSVHNKYLLIILFLSVFNITLCQSIHWQNKIADNNDCKFINENIAIIVGDDGKVLVNKDSTFKNWNRLETGINFNFREICSQNLNDYYILADSGVILKGNILTNNFEYNYTKLDISTFEMVDNDNLLLFTKNNELIKFNFKISFKEVLKLFNGTALNIEKINDTICLLTNNGYLNFSIDNGKLWNEKFIDSSSNFHFIKSIFYNNLFYICYKQIEYPYLTYIDTLNFQNILGHLIQTSSFINDFKIHNNIIETIGNNGEYLIFNKSGKIVSKDIIHGATNYSANSNGLQINSFDIWKGKLLAVGYYSSIAYRSDYNYKIDSISYIYHSTQDSKTDFKLFNSDYFIVGKSQILRSQDNLNSILKAFPYDSISGDKIDLFPTEFRNINYVNYKVYFCGNAYKGQSDSLVCSYEKSINKWTKINSIASYSLDINDQTIISTNTHEIIYSNNIENNWKNIDFDPNKLYKGNLSILKIISFKTYFLAYAHSLDFNKKGNFIIQIDKKGYFIKNIIEYEFPEYYFTDLIKDEFDNLYLIESRTILKSSDDGKNWSSLNFNSDSKISMKCMGFINKNLWIIGGLNDSILISKDGGLNWKLEVIKISHSKAYRPTESIIVYSKILRIDNSSFLILGNNRIVVGIIDTTITSLESNISTAEIPPFSPNPVKDKLFIKYKGYEDNEPITIMNIVGASLIETTIKEYIDVSSLLSGLYFLKIRNQVFKFVKE